MTNEQEIKELKLRLEQLEKTLGTLISWLGQSATGAISIHEAETLIKMMVK